MKKLYLILLVLPMLGVAQSVQILDAKDGASIPFANIRINNLESLISNAEGYFYIPTNIDDDASVVISYIGYVEVQTTTGKIRSQNNVIRMSPGVFTLDTVDVSNVKPDAYKIMAEVKNRLAVNYKTDPTATKNTIFYRKTTGFSPTKLDIEVDKSTGFSKKQLADVNRELTGFTNSLISHPPKGYTDVLCNYYTAVKQKENKPLFHQKLEVVKAAKLFDENRSTSLDELQRKGMHILLQQVDTSKYYRIKSGLFGSRDTISLRKDFQKKGQKKPSEIVNTRSTLAAFIQLNKPGNSKFDFITNPEIYNYSYEGALYSSSNEFIYVLNFKPKKSKAKYAGKVYVSETDYAIVRTDFSLAKGKSLGGVNLKLLLGVKASENVSNGTLIFKPGESGAYYLQFASIEEGQYMYINRPLKFIELADGEKDVVAFDLKFELNMNSKMEFLNISRSAISAEAFDSQKENEFAYVALKQYNPDLWKDYGVIAPVEEMKQFKIAE